MAKRLWQPINMIPVCSYFITNNNLSAQYTFIEHLVCVDILRGAGGSKKVLFAVFLEGRGFRDLLSKLSEFTPKTSCYTFYPFLFRLLKEPPVYSFIYVHFHDLFHYITNSLHVFTLCSINYMYFHYIYFHYLFYFHLFPRKIVHFPYSQWQLFMHRPPYACQNSLYVISFETH